ncbi:MAG: 4Fe-4S dicluster domain-containing protein, partial [Planctomycetota bacterium]
MSPEATENIIDATTLDPNFKHEIAKLPGGENLKLCFTCGTCTASCPVREVDERYNPRKIIRMMILGMKDKVLKSDFMWLCTACYSCQERCPQDVKITDLMVALKNYAVQHGHVHPGIAAQAEPIMKDGRIYPIEDFDNKKREKQGLPPVTP